MGFSAGLTSTAPRFTKKTAACLVPLKLACWDGEWQWQRGQGGVGRGTIGSGGPWTHADGQLQRGLRLLRLLRLLLWLLWLRLRSMLAVLRRW